MLPPFHSKPRTNEALLERISRMQRRDFALLLPRRPKTQYIANHSKTPIN